MMYLLALFGAIQIESSCDFNYSVQHLYNGQWITLASHEAGMYTDTAYVFTPLVAGFEYVKLSGIDTVYEVLDSVFLTPDNPPYIEITECKIENDSIEVHINAHSTVNSFWVGVTGKICIFESMNGCFSFPKTLESLNADASWVVKVQDVNYNTYWIQASGESTSFGTVQTGICAIDVTGIEGMENEKAVVEIYNLYGQRLPEEIGGINIIKFSNGETKLIFHH